MGRRNKKAVKKRATNHRNTVKAYRKMRARRKSRGKHPIGKKRASRAARRIAARRG